RRRPQSPRGLADIVERRLRKNPQERYASAAVLLADLAGALSPEARVSRVAPLRNRRRAVLVVSVIALMALTGVALWLAGPGENRTPTLTVAPGEVRRVLVADFADFTADSLLGDAVSRALGVDLARSPAIQVAGTASVVGGRRR